MSKLVYNPGEMDQRVSVLREARTDDGMGGASVELTTLFEAWAHVRPRSGTEQFIADRVSAEATYLFVIRYRDTVRDDDIIQWQGVNYNIRMIQTRGPRKLYLEIEAERGVGQ